MANSLLSGRLPPTEAHQSPALQKSTGRRKKAFKDPFPVVETTETPIMSTEEFNREDSRTPSPTPLPPFRPNPSALPKSVNRLRPAQDILNRLIWDSGLNDSSKTVSNGDWTYIIGYLDRFDGIKEITLDDWMSRRTDRDGEDWVPMHRVLLVKRRLKYSEEGSGQIPEIKGDPRGAEESTDGILWDRRQRIDRVFGSGNSTGDTE